MDGQEHESLLLLLRGSASHLLINAPAASIDPRDLGMNRSALSMVLRDLRRVPLPEAEHLAADPVAARPHPYAVHMVLRAGNGSPDSAAWMCGFARVTRSVPPRDATLDEPRPALVATPLYVEYAHDLPY
ncbi:SAVMC3_10250 family protein [Streptomyces sp. NPDC050534]|uniref:SAVMC3_10250 family protein n=1 Tax=Streptomyces sp. NPDC050534 TaxID=3365625 RepID=UPI0037B998A9